MRSDLPAGTVTFLFTDVEGSTKLLLAMLHEQLDEVAFAETWEKGRELTPGRSGRARP